MIEQLLYDIKKLDIKKQELQEKFGIENIKNNKITFMEHLVLENLFDEIEEKINYLFIACEVQNGEN